MGRGARGDEAGGRASGLVPWLDKTLKQRGVTCAVCPNATPAPLHSFGPSTPSALHPSTPSPSSTRHQEAAILTELLQRRLRKQVRREPVEEGRGRGLTHEGGGGGLTHGEETADMRGRGLTHEGGGGGGGLRSRRAPNQEGSAQQGCSRMGATMWCVMTTRAAGDARATPQTSPGCAEAAPAGAGAGARALLGCNTHACPLYYCALATTSLLNYSLFMNVPPPHPTLCPAGQARLRGA